jgi:hypothetical protein
VEAYTRWNLVSSDQPATAAGTTPATLARNVLQSLLEQRWERLPSLIHPDAEMEAGFSTPGARFDAKQFVDAAWAASMSGAYRPEYELVVALDEHTALVVARIRFQVGKDDVSERDAAYLMTFKDSLLWRTRVFDSVDEALAALGAGEREHPDV